MRVTAVRVAISPPAEPKRSLLMRALKVIFLSIVVLGAGVLWSFTASAASAKPLRLTASLLAGYDNNTGLNAQRKGDLFFQEAFGARYKHSIDPLTRYRLSYDVTNVNYADATDQNILAQSAGVGLDRVLFGATILEMDYGFEYLYFPNNDSVSSTAHQGRVGLKQLVNDQWTARAGLSVLARNFEDRKLRTPEGITSPEDERRDRRHGADADLTYRFSKTGSIKGGIQYYRNDSNDQFHDYYDFDSIRVWSGVNFKPRPNLSAFVRLAYENRDYASRPLIDDVRTLENDDVYTGTLGLFYPLGKGFSLGGIYTYREKRSNEPSQKYSGSISTLGLYSSF